MAKGPEQAKGCTQACAGFTLIELMIAVVILAVLALGAVPLLERASQRTKEDELRVALRQIREAIDAYKRAGDQGKFPRKADESGYPPSLEVLTEGVTNAQPTGPRRLFFLRRVPRDPFFPDRAAPAARTWGLRSYDSPPDRPASGKDVFDVFSLSEGVGMNGVPYRDW